MVAAKILQGSYAFGNKKKKKKMKKIESSLGGLEPPTFRLTAERANRLRHRDELFQYFLNTV